jgi:hypothetical protein
MIRWTSLPLLMASEESLEATEIAGKAVGQIVVIFAVTAWRAYLLSLCSALLFPLVALSFWQWCLIAITFRFMTAPPLSFK